MGAGGHDSRNQSGMSEVASRGAHAPAGITSNFTYHSDPVRIVFGAGAIEALRAEADLHKISRFLVLCSPARADLARKVIAPVADRCLGFCETAGQTMPHDAFDRILAELKRVNANGFIVIGGGSPIGLAKAAAATSGLPYIAVVTTYSGSEMAARWYIGVAEDRVNGESVAALPATAIYDPELTLDLPPGVSAASGMNAMAHAVESLYGIDTNPVVQSMAEKAVRLLGASLPRVVENPRDLAARTDALYAAWLAGNFRAKVGLEHAIAQRVRQWFNLDHARTHAIATPYAVGFNAAAAPDAMRRIERALGVNDAARGLYDLNVRLGLPTGFKDLGLKESDIDKAVEVVLAAKIAHPRPVAKADLRNVIGQAFAGALPRF
jgi:maleylacetate reductase